MKQSPYKNQLEADKLSNVLKQITEIDEVAGSSANLMQIVNLICDELEFYYVGIYLLVNESFGDETEEFLVLIAASEEKGLLESSSLYRKRVGNKSLIGWVAKNHQARIALDIGENAVQFRNPLLPDIRSEIALPITFEGKLIGVLDIHSVYESAFSEDDVVLLQPITNYIADILQHRAT